MNVAIDLKKISVIKLDGRKVYMWNDSMILFFDWSFDSEKIASDFYNEIVSKAKLNILDL